MLLKSKRSFSIVITLLIFCIIQLARCEQVSWDCTECGRTDNTGNFCGSCGHSSPWIADAMLEDDNEIETETKEINIGDIITFGHYEQDNNIENGPEKIEWIVLDVQDGKALMLSKYGLDAKAYNIIDTYCTWETCTLRTWLNGDFMNQAFNAEEQSVILSTMIDNSRSQGWWNTSSGNNTQDQIFLLSYAEANKYLGVYPNVIVHKSRVAPTDYAIAQGAYKSDQKTEDGKAAGWWWLRSRSIAPYGGDSSTAIVLHSGALHGYTSIDSRASVRPALWINLESDIFTHSSTVKDEEKNIKIGDTIPFGHYEQDNNIENGPEEIKWIVLDIQEGKALLHSKFILEAMAFDESSSAYWWENCSLRSWLNLDFLNTAFSSEERDMILMTEVANDASQCRVYGVISGATTNEKVFLLSYHEVYDLYYPDEEIRKKVSTDYAQTGRYLGFSPWWLRTSSNDRCADYIGCNGKSGSTYKSMTYIGVIPALWIKFQLN